MKIAQVAPLYESVPPHGYGGTERVVSYLTDELVRIGEDRADGLRTRRYHPAGAGVRRSGMAVGTDQDGERQERQFPCAATSTRPDGGGKRLDSCRQVC